MYGTRVSEVRMECKECGKEIKVKGHWYNQLFIEDYCDIKYWTHSLKNRHNLQGTFGECILEFMKIDTVNCVPK